MRYVLICVLGLAVLGSPSAEAAPATRGVIDLSGLDVRNGDTAKLDGEWAFYWAQLLTPADFASGKFPPDAEYMRVPSAWSQSSYRGQALPKKGDATYRLKIKPPAGTHALALRLLDWEMPCRVWINGVASGLRAGEEEGPMSWLPLYAPHVFEFASTGEEIDVVVQVSNQRSQDNRFGSIEIGSAETIHFSQIRRWLLQVLLIGGMLVMGVYHLSLFVMRKRDLSSLCFSLYCMVRIVYSVFVGEGLAYLIYPEIPPLLPGALLFLSIYLAPVVSLAFFRTVFPQQFSRRIWWCACGISAAVIAVDGFHLFLLPAAFKKCFYVYSLLVIIYIIVCLLRAWRARQTGAGLFILGYLVLALSLVNDMLNASAMIVTVFVGPVGMFVLILFQSFALARKFTNAHEAVENLSGTLEAQNRALHEEIKERIRLEQEMEKIGDEERRAVSRQLHDGLCQELAAARLHCVLLAHSQPASDPAGREVGALSSLLGKAVDQAYELSRGLWPVEHETRDLLASIEELASKLRETCSLDVKVNCQLTCARCANQNVSQIYYITREALQNVCKHAQARHVVITLDCQQLRQSLKVRIEDDGVGRAASTGSQGGGLGSRIMAHRAQMIGAELCITDREGGGTVVMLSVPCELSLNACREVGAGSSRDAANALA